MNIINSITFFLLILWPIVFAVLRTLRKKDGYKTVFLSWMLYVFSVCLMVYISSYFDENGLLGKRGASGIVDLVKAVISGWATGVIGLVIGKLILIFKEKVIKGVPSWNILIPPLFVYRLEGISSTLFVCMVFTLCNYFPGLLFAIWLYNGLEDEDGSENMDSDLTR